MPLEQGSAAHFGEEVLERDAHGLGELHEIGRIVGHDAVGVLASECVCPIIQQVCDRRYRRDDVGGLSATESKVSPSIFHPSAFTGIRVIPIFLDRKGE